MLSMSKLVEFTIAHAFLKYAAVIGIETVRIGRIKVSFDNMTILVDELSF